MGKEDSVSAWMAGFLILAAWGYLWWCGVLAGWAAVVWPKVHAFGCKREAAMCMVVAAHSCL